MIKVMIVDDKEANRFVLTNFIKLFGNKSNIEILESDSGANALNKLKSMEDIPSLVMMDIKMENDTAGIETVKAIRSDERLKDIEVWAITAQAMEGSGNNISDKDKCLEAGFNDYVSKPFDLAILLKKISAHLSLEIPANIRNKMGLN